MSELIAGDIFDDKYEILKVLGAGGIGTVYQARQIDIERIVALKILHPHVVVDEEFKLRFLREAQALNKFSHAKIVTIYHLGLAETGSPYIVMEFIEGKSLRFLLNNTERMATVRALRVIRDAALALEHVHKHGIIHRDLKPDNIILLDLPEADTVKIIDFGLARNEDESGNQRLTSTGALIGTVNYMSPEQCAGKRADQRSDIYSLALCLYEMLVGEAVYCADTPMGVMYQHLNSPVPEIKVQNVERFSPELNVLLGKALAKDPEKRFQSMAAFAEGTNETIDDLAENKPRKVVSSGLALLSILLLASVAVVFVIFMNAKKNESQSPLQADGKSGKLRRYTDNVIASEVFSGNREKAKKMCESTLSFSNLSNYQRARVLVLLSNLSPNYFSAACLMEAIRLLGNDPKARLQKLQANLYLANSLRGESMPVQALKCLTYTMKDVEKNGMPDIPKHGSDFDQTQLLQAYSTAIQLNIEIGKPAQALELLEKALSMVDPEDENAPYAQLCRSALSLKKKDIVKKLISTTNMVKPLVEMSVQCLRYQETALTRACLDKALNADTVSDGHILFRSIILDLAEARYLLTTGNVKKAREILGNQIDRLKNTRRNDRDIFSQDTLILMKIGGVDTKETESIFGITQSERPRAATRIATNYEQILAAYNRYSAGSTNEVPGLLDSIKQALSGSSISTEQRCHLLLLGWTLEGERKDELLVQAAELLEKDKEGQLGRALKMRARLQYGRLLQKANLTELSRRIYETVYADLMKNGMPQGERIAIFADDNRCQLVSGLAKIYFDTGNLKALNPLIEDQNFVCSESDNFLMALELGRKNLARKFIENENRMDPLRTLVARCTSRHDEELAKLALNKCIWLSKLVTDEKSKYFYNMQNTVSKVIIDIEFAHTQKEAAKDVESLLHCDYSKLPAETKELVRNQTTLLLYLLGAASEGRKFLPGPSTNGRGGP